MTCCSGAPNSPSALTRSSTAAAPNISRRSARPRSCNSLVSISFSSCFGSIRPKCGPGTFPRPVAWRQHDGRKKLYTDAAPDSHGRHLPFNRQDFAAMTTATAHAEFKSGRPHGSLAVLALGALGVVYGDIGTSPLYTMKTVLDWEGANRSPEVALGTLSLIVWTLIITTSI